jgi:uncharacterized membrane protein
VNDLPLPAFSDWRVAFGSQLPQQILWLVCAAALFAVVLSAISLIWERRRWRALGLLTLRGLGVGACLVVALQPQLELGQVTRVPNHVAVLVDGSRSMTVRPPDGGKPRTERARDVVVGAAPLFDRWRADGHKVDLFTFGEALEPTTPAGLQAPPRGEATRLGETLAEVRARYAGRDLGGVVILSDGNDTGRIGRGPVDGETRKTLAAMDAPVHTVWIGERALKDLSVAAVLVDDFAFVRTPIKLEAVIRASGLANRQIEVTLTRDGRLQDVRSLHLQDDETEARVAFDWTPDRPGNVVFEIATPVLAGEALATNNKQVFTLKVIRDRVRVLHVCGRPSWDQRFLRSLLRLDPNVDLVSFFILRTNSDDQPWNRDELSLIPFPDREIFDEQLRSFDMLIFQNFNSAPEYRVEPYLPGLRDYVQSGGAMVMVGGDLSFASGGYANTVLRDVLPVELDGIPSTGERSQARDTFKPKLTPEGRTHPVTSLSLDDRANEARWAALPALEGMNRVSRLRAGASALLAHPTAKTEAGEPAPVLAAAEAGKGRTLALLTDSAWHWGFLSAGAGDDGRAFQRFWENAIRWLVRDPTLTLLRLELDRVEYRRGQTVAARVRSLNPDYTPAGGTSVTVQLLPVEGGSNGATNVTTKPLRELQLTTSKDGEANFELAGLAAGAYRLRATATLAGRTLVDEQTLVLRTEGRELEDVIAREGVLRELSALTGGDFADGALGAAPLKKPREVRVGNLKTIEIWSHPGLLALAMLLLASEWALRRRAGHG